MLDWIKNIGKDYPEFWKEYVSKFDKKSQRFVVFSAETSGLNPEKDVILSIGSFAIIDNSIAIGDSFEAVLLQYKYLHDNKLSNEFIVGSKLKKLSEPDAIKEFIDYIGNSILVGHHVNFDVEMINVALEKLNCGRLKNEALDIEVMYQKLHDVSDKQFSLDELCNIHKIPVSERNSASESAYKIGLLFLKFKSKLGL
jgi:DNA polymerase III subunit epsilon